MSRVGGERAELRVETPIEEAGGLHNDTIVTIVVASLVRSSRRFAMMEALFKTNLPRRLESFCFGKTNPWMIAI